MLGIEKAPKRNHTIGEDPTDGTLQPLPVDGAGTHYSTASAPRAFSDSEALARDIKEGKLTGYIGHNIELTGTISFKGALRVDGRFAGVIDAEDGTLVLSAGGQIDAEIKIASAKLNGIVKGNIRASRNIDISRSAKVVADIQTTSLVIEEGAFFEGSCRMTQVNQVPNEKGDLQQKAKRASA